MTTDQLLFAAQKTVRSLGEVELEELPPIVYQALLLANKVCEYFLFSEYPLLMLPGTQGHHPFWNLCADGQARC